MRHPMPSLPKLLWQTRFQVPGKVVLPCQHSSHLCCSLYVPLTKREHDHQNLLTRHHRTPSSSACLAAHLWPGPRHLRHTPRHVQQCRRPTSSNRSHMKWSLAPHHQSSKNPGRNEASMGLLVLQVFCSACICIVRMCQPSRWLFKLRSR